MGRKLNKFISAIETEHISPKITDHAFKYHVSRIPNPVSRILYLNSKS